MRFRSFSSDEKKILTPPSSIVRDSCFTTTRTIQNLGVCCRRRLSNSSGLAGVESVFFITVLVIFATSLVVSLARLSYAKVITDNLAYNAARLETLDNSIYLPGSLTEVSIFGERVKLTSPADIQPCSYITVKASATLPILPVPYLRQITYITVASTTTLPTDAYKVAQSLGLNCQ
ncbi:hypothetical protein SAMN02745225_01090 [Ferrithrix thermotolerans DSM 19514]|uniref:TadE-like protein n=1 Tax=Ferrithrix thermotolerans DSM 19514 TaxID=1121881 RepID=A0A1M4UU79_9ACTN|nr:hypothetical protein SAMN02745225_01090 [Ferrithrix thermotolerans DSM 19514]